MKANISKRLREYLNNDFTYDAFGYFAAILLMVIIVSGIQSCCNTSYDTPQRGVVSTTTTFPKQVYNGHRWDVIQISEDVFVIAPGLNANSRSEPVVFNKKEVKHINVEGWKP